MYHNYHFKIGVSDSKNVRKSVQKASKRVPKVNHFRFQKASVYFRAFRRISMILAALLRYRFWTVRKHIIVWLFEPRSQTVVDTGSF